MPAYKLTAPRNLGKIPKGFVIQVASQSSTPQMADIRKAIIRAGFEDRHSLSYCASGNWKVEKL